MKNFGIIGTGNIATIVLNQSSSLLNKISKIYLYDLDKNKLANFLKKFGRRKIYRNKFVLCNSILEVIKKSDVILESASINAVKEVLDGLIPYKEKTVIFLSVGGILQNYNTYRSLISKGYKIKIPSGAIAGCDALSAVSFAKIKSIELITTKPTSSLIDTPFFKLHPRLYKQTLKSSRKEIFRGNVYDAIKYFPQNINVASTLAIFSGSPWKVKVKIVADKTLKVNIHEVRINSSVGNIYVRTENLPSLENPKTSYLAALSVLPILRESL